MWEGQYGVIKHMAHNILIWWRDKLIRNTHGVQCFSLVLLPYLFCECISLGPSAGMDLCYIELNTIFSIVIKFKKILLQYF